MLDGFMRHTTAANLDMIRALMNAGYGGEAAGSVHSIQISEIIKKIETRERNATFHQILIL